MRTTNYDALATLAPLDATAATVRDATGEHWDAPVSEGDLQWDICPKLVEIFESHTENATFENLTGRRFGRLTVRGLLDYEAAGVARHEKKGGRWVCRCDCGEFTAKFRKALITARHEQRCRKCDYLDHIKWRASQRNTSTSRGQEAARLDKLAGAR